MDKLNLDQHISQQYNSALDGLKTEFLAMGGIVEQQIIDAVEATLFSSSVSLLKRPAFVPIDIFVLTES